jgi:hypothetical protein
MRITINNVSDPVAPHAVRDEAKLANLVEAFEAGEAVSPVVVLRLGDDDSYPRAITGSHRIAAANKAGVDVPTICIQATNAWERGVLSWVLSTGNFEDKVSLVRRMATRRGWRKTIAALEDQ